MNKNSKTFGEIGKFIRSSAALCKNIEGLEYDLNMMKISYNNPSSAYLVADRIIEKFNVFLSIPQDPKTGNYTILIITGWEGGANEAAAG